MCLSGPVQKPLGGPGLSSCPASKISFPPAAENTKPDSRQTQSARADKVKHQKDNRNHPQAGRHPRAEDKAPPTRDPEGPPRAQQRHQQQPPPETAGTRGPTGNRQTTHPPPPRAGGARAPPAKGPSNQGEARGKPKTRAHNNPPPAQPPTGTPQSRAQAPATTQRSTNGPTSQTAQISDPKPTHSQAASNGLAVGASPRVIRQVPSLTIDPGSTVQDDLRVRPPQSH